MSTQVFVLELPIKDSDDVVRFLNRKFDFALSLYNATLHTALGRLERMRNSREWREAILLPKGKERSRKLAEIRFSFGLTEFSLGKIANGHRNGAKRFVRKTDPGAKRVKNECILGVEVAEAIGSRVWRSVERYLFGKGGRPRFKSRGRGLHSLENKSNHANIIWHPKEKAFAGIDAEYRSKYLLANTLGKRFQILRTLLNPVNLSIAGFAEDASEAVGAIFCSSS